MNRARIILDIPDCEKDRQFAERLIKVLDQEKYNITVISEPEAGSNAVSEEVRKLREAEILCYVVIFERNRKKQIELIQAGAIDCIPVFGDEEDLEYVSFRLEKTYENIFFRFQELAAVYKNLQEEMTLAQAVQRKMFPARINNETINIDGIYMPIEVLGGDLYYWKRISEDQYAVILLDVMGHGVATSLICIYLRTLVADMMVHLSDPRAFIWKLNETMVRFNAQLSGQTYHLTAFYMIADMRQRTIEYVNAAHPYAILMGQDAKSIYLDKGCIPLGIFDDITIETGKVSYEAKSSLFLYSDGIYELLKLNGLDVEYLINYVKYYGINEIDSYATLDKLSTMLELFPRNDDVSLVFMQLR